MSMAEAQEAVAQQQAALQAAALHQAHQAVMEAAQHQVGSIFGAQQNLSICCQLGESTGLP